MSDVIKVTNYRWKEIFFPLFKNPTRVIFFSMWEFFTKLFILSTDSSVTEFLEWCQNQLRAFYNTMCQVKITPWDPNNTVHINDIYIQVTFLQDHKKPDGTTKKKNWETAMKYLKVTNIIPSEFWYMEDLE